MSSKNTNSAKITTPGAHVVGSSTKRTTSFGTVLTTSGAVDQRYTEKQFIKNDGTRDMRTNLTSKRP